MIFPDQVVRENPCTDCGHDTSHNGLAEGYMVTNEVWEQATILYPDQNASVRWLCIGCLEQRINRKLNSIDFKDVLLNRIINDMRFRQICPKSLRLRDRLQKEPVDD